MTDLFFVDSNVLIYGRDAAEPAKQPLANAWIAALWRTKRGRISMQVLLEYYSKVRRWPTPDPDAEREYARWFFRWYPLRPNRTTLERAWTIEQKHLIHFWDALIVAAAEQQRCRYVL